MSSFALLACCLLMVTYHVDSHYDGSTEPKPGISMDDLVTPHGYPLEKYQVQTEDGYILTIHRIPHGRNGASPRKKLPLLLMHGLGSFAPHFVLNLEGLGFQLVDEGYDVWLPNARGTYYSRGHVDPLLDKRSYFDYSFQEIGIYDLPASIDFILQQTSKDALYYVGHSQGTTTFFAMASARPEYNNKVRAAALLAPVAYIDYIKGALMVLHRLNSLLEYLKRWGYYELSPTSYRVEIFGRPLCEGWRSRYLCYPFMETLVGFDTQRFNMSLMETIATVGTGGISFKQLQHYGQIIGRDGKFSMYDYGTVENVKHYGQSFPPEYNLTKITIPTLAIYAQNDYLSTLPDVRRLHSEVPSLALDEIPDPLFNHIDFIWGKNVKHDVCDKIVAYLNS